MTEIDEKQRNGEQTSLRIGAVCAMLGAVLSVVAGIGFGNLTNELGPEDVLRYLASRPEWYWPVTYLGFIFGALFWILALLVLAGSLGGIGRAFGRFGVAAVVLGASIHVVDSSISGFGLAALAGEWVDASPSDQANLLLVGDALLWVLGGTWANVLILFHGLPFVLFGLAVVLDRSYPTWLGWIGTLGGLGSVAAGISMFLGADIFPQRLFIVFALVVSVFMLTMGALMWRRAGAAQKTASRR